MDSTRWNQLCSSMDVIGDTELAINAYLESIDKPANTGELYILLYGILQVLFVQQDAVRHLAEALDLESEPNKNLTAIREIRNDSTGHPTKREQGKGKGKEKEKWFNFITRISMSRDGFTLMSTYPNRNSTFKQVDVNQLIREQRNELRKILNDVIDYLQRESMEHKNMYKDEKLADIFPQTMLYFYEKISETIFGNAPPEFGLGFLDIIAEVVQKFKAALEERQIFQAYNVADDFEWAEYSLSKLHQYFNGTSEVVLNDKDAYIYLSFIQKQLSDLHQIAKEIDDEYESKE